MLKVLTIVGTRPEIIRLSRSIELLDRQCEHYLVHTGQNYDYELNAIFFEQLKIREPDIYLEAAGSSAAETIGNVIIKVDKILEDIRPDAVLILGDTNSAMAAIPAKRRKIPIFHMEAGNRCYDQRVPEEINRRIVDHISDINLTYSSIARDYLLREGLAPDQVIKIGSPMYEVLHHYMPQINNSRILSTLGLLEYQYFLISCHREENVDDSRKFNDFLGLLNWLATEYGIPIIVSTHPRTRKRIDKLDIKTHPLVRLLSPQGFFDYVCLQKHARVVLSDSGTITEESSILNFPALSLRECHERPEGMEEAVLIMAGMSIARVGQSINILASQRRGLSRSISLVGDYNVRNVSEKLLRIIYSYTDYVNRVVWKKY